MSQKSAKEPCSCSAHHTMLAARGRVWWRIGWVGAGPVGPVGAGSGRGVEEDQDSLSATPSCRLVWLCMMHTAAVRPSVSSAHAYNDGMHWRCALAVCTGDALAACTAGVH